MGRRLTAAGGLLLFCASGFAGCAAPRQAAGGPSPFSRAAADEAQSARGVAELEYRHLRWPEDRRLLLDAARTAWTFADRHDQPGTGFITPLATFRFATMWDVGSMLAALYSAHELGLVGDAAYERQIRRILATLHRMPLNRHGVFNKAYDTASGTMVRFRRDSVEPGEAGWSAIDVGRLLIWLRILAVDSRFEHDASAVVYRLDYRPIVRAGYLWGDGPDKKGELEAYQEGHIGYEQYAARGLALWGQRAEKALSLKENALPVSVMGQPLLADYRRRDRLTSEPFLLWGLELGWDPQAALLARRLLLAQEARYRSTGHITFAGEDAMSEPPHYFYYYCVFANGKAFGVDVQDRDAVVEGPRWISAKSAFAFHALTPSAYTAAAVRALGAARSASGWGSGAYETTGRPTGNININTAAVILEAALFESRGRPFLREASGP
jgi:uncharacterized protein DUF3131